jgi:hypothetical protein
MSFQRRKRKAFLVGINYVGQSAELRGCHNDVCSVYELLIDTYGWDGSEIRLLTDSCIDPRKCNGRVSNVELPTRENIIKGLKWLVSDVARGDALFFHFSGHGSQVEDLNGFEEDGMNETILPCMYMYLYCIMSSRSIRLTLLLADFNESGQISDDEISKIIVENLPEGVRLTALMDSCHSGTGLIIQLS